MPVDPAHHRLLHGRGTRSFTNFTRYTQLPSTEESGSDGSTPSDSPLTPPLRRAPRGVNTEVRLAEGGRAAVHLRQGGRPPVSRPCHRLRNASSGPGQTRYSKLGSVSEEGPAAAPRNGGAGILRAVTSRGRGYEDLRCRGAGGEAPDSGDSSTQSSPRVSPRVSPRASPRTSPKVSPRASPPNGRKKSSGILITSALARSGIKRLSRVSFGSSKGSMVETLIYDSPVAEEERIPEEETPTFRDPVSQMFGTDSGRDNPFRPDGDISREADEIVQLIKSGRPLQGQAGQRPGDFTDSIDGPQSSPTGKEAVTEPLFSPKDASPQQQQQPQQLQQQHQPTPTAVPTKPLMDSTPSPPGKAGANGSAAPENSTPGTVEVTHVTVTPTDAAHVEHVVIKKKSKCNCCVIQ
ncbi:uncharacterized protein DKFZp434B061 isoform X2 [Cherax quadricarinatus]|uniref:uncharacterized protein DKFZp434B061 isoform X2 n=1 Tax=Cherax quadricarinatus TaxID=27406 RepID=UPI0023785A81|nr:uncharacterized protein DKFZp434B061-like isoform X2 [Cherax quadricarinatus]